MTFIKLRKTFKVTSAAFEDPEFKGLFLTYLPPF